MIDDDTDIMKEFAPEIYRDVAQPSAQATGGLLALFPRYIRAKLASIEVWILKREYKVKEIAKLLDEKLKNIPEDQIDSPEPHIAVPAFQYISYCIDNRELRDMYANLLASSMNKFIKDGVHPSYVELIKQLCPDEAKILKYVFEKGGIPTISLYRGNNLSGFIRVVKDFSDVGYLVHCERPLDFSRYFDNLVRLGLLESSDSVFSVSSPLADKQLYVALKEHSHIKSLIKNMYDPNDSNSVLEIIEGCISITSYGQGFCFICLSVLSGKSENEPVFEKTKFLSDEDFATSEDVQEMIVDVFGRECQ